MGMARINVFALLSDQFRFLRDVGTGKPARLTRLLVLVTGPAIGVASYLLGWQVQSVSELASGLGLMAGVFLSAFAIVFSLRLTLADRPSSNIKQLSSRLMDEGALTLLAAGLLAGVDAMWLSVATATTPKDSEVSVLATAITAGLSSLVALYFLLSVRRLHILYTDTFPPYWRAQKAVDGPGSGQKRTSGKVETQERKSTSNQHPRRPS
jgi:mannitol-specific phosphotransferase system IIBC component